MIAPKCAQVPSLPSRCAYVVSFSLLFRPTFLDLRFSILLESMQFASWSARFIAELIMKMNHKAIQTCLGVSES